MHRSLLLPVIASLAALLVSASAAAATLEARRGEFRSALTQAERGPALTPQARRTLLDHPLFAYIEYAELRRSLGQARALDVEAVLERYSHVPFTGALRTEWLRELAKREDWPAFMRFHRPQTDPELQCHALRARLTTESGTATLLDDIAAMWLHGQSRPTACDGAFAHLEASGRVDAALRWQRIDLAAQSGNLALMRFLARSLPAPARQHAEAYAGFLEQPVTTLKDWPRDDRSRRIAVLGLERLARRDQAGAEALLPSVATALAFSPAERGQVQYAVALWSVASYLPGSANRLNTVPADQYDERLHEWRAREALARGDAPAMLAAISAMPQTQRDEGRWRYLAARMHEQQGDDALAQPLYAGLATEPNYFGFLAADRIGANYALCPIEPLDDRATRTRLLALPGLRRALELHALDRPEWALREWNAAIATLDDDERRQAIALAVDAGWTDRAVFGLAQGDDMRLYRLRFPLAHDRHLRSEAEKHGLDPAWVAALIRAESAWQPNARSHADARGLMQLLPGTGSAVARRHAVEWPGVNVLYQPRTNISLGTAYLGEQLARHDGQAYLATAAYNAGPTPVARWRQQRPPVEPDLWVETIPYRETREYVSRIMAFAVIYDWRFGGRAVPVIERMRGRSGAALAVREFACPTIAAAQ